jgi:hypothetical protein
MSLWTRRTELGGPPRRQLVEQWDYERERRALSCEIEVTIGKTLDVLALKGTSLAEIRDYAGFLAGVAKRLYGPGAQTVEHRACPICRAEDIGSDALSVFGVPYARCGQCGHGFVRQPPTAEALDAVFTESAAHSAVYVDRASLETRLAQIIAPKADWVLEQYRRRYRHAPKTALDVGAGGGHFVEGMRRRNVMADGYERSRASRDFAVEAFGVTLRHGDFLSDPPERRDLVTMWGLLEYLPDPRRFLERARQWLNPADGLLIVEVPRLDCLGTAIQREAPTSVARHMDPTSHMNAFTDASLATALVETGFRPIAAWYFGMDVYELFCQAALRLGNDETLPRLAELIPALQASLDDGRQCDDIVMAALPA